MRTIIISVDHRDETGKFWSDSYVKKSHVTVNDNESLHDAIVRHISESDSVVFSYKGKPQGNIYRDDKDGNSKIVGYHYRTKHFISDRSADVQRDNVPFTTWVTVHGEMEELTLEDVEA